MANPLKKQGSILVENALILPWIIFLILGLLQWMQIMQISWFVDQAIEAACRAFWVQKQGHPDPEVAAQLVMAPVTGTTFLRKTSPLPQRGLTGMVSRYGASIGKTTVSVEKNQRIVSCQLNHAAELSIPFVNRVFAPLADPINWVKRTILKRNTGDLAEKWSLVTGVPHLLIKKKLEISY